MADIDKEQWSSAVKQSVKVTVYLEREVRSFGYIKKLEMATGCCTHAKLALSALAIQQL